MWIDAPKPAPVVGVALPSPASPIKTLTVFKTCSSNSSTISVAEEPAQDDGNFSRRATTATPAVEPKAPPVAASKVNAILDQLYSQCEQLADALCQESDEMSLASEQAGAGGCAVSETMSAFDQQSACELASTSCDSWMPVDRHNLSQQLDELDELDEQQLLTGEDRDLDENEPDDDDDDDEDQQDVGEPLAREQIRSMNADYSPEYIEVEEPDEPVATQDSCLQVTGTNDYNISVLDVSHCFWFINHFHPLIVTAHR